MSEDPYFLLKLKRAFERYHARDFDASKALCAELLEQVPNQPDVTNLLALVARATKKWGKAELIVREGIEANPYSASLQNTLGLLAMDQRRFAEAEAAFRRAVQIKPHQEEFKINLSRALHELGYLDAANTELNSVIDEKPLPNAYIQLARIALERGDIAAASGAIEEASKLNAPLQELLTVRAIHALTEGRLDKAYALFDECVNLTEDVADATVNRGLIRMLQGQIEDGWDDYNMRHKRRWDRTVKRSFPHPVWTGEGLKKKTLLLWGEQGLGESILCGSLLHRVATEADRIILECDLRLLKLFRRSFPDVDIVARTNPPNELLQGGAIDYSSSYLDLLRYRCPDLRQPIHACGYLKADDKYACKLRDQYQSETGRKLLVGLCWASPKAVNARVKAIDPLAWKPLLSVPDVAFVNLQYGDDREALSEQAKSCGAVFITDSNIDQDSDLDQVTAQIAALDLVITVSTTVAHLSGALGKRNWVLLPPMGLGTMWYWFVNQDDSPWYPRVRLHRRKHGRAQDVHLLSSLASDLRKLTTIDSLP